MRRSSECIDEPITIWSAEMRDERRAYIVRLLTEADYPVHINALAILIGIHFDARVPQRMLENGRFHDSRYRRILTEDIRSINVDPFYDGVYISSTGLAGLRVVTDGELETMIERKISKAKRILRDASEISRKTGLRGQYIIAFDVGGGDAKC